MPMNGNSKWKTMSEFAYALLTAPLNIIFWMKWIAAYFVTCVYKVFFGRKRFDLYDPNSSGDPVKAGFIVPQLERYLESPFPQSHLQECSDEVLFYGVNSKSECLFVRVSRSWGGVTDACIHLRLAGGTAYQWADRQKRDWSVDGKSANFSCGKLQVHFLSPMRTWRIFYSGMLRDASDETKNSVFVKFVFLWKASSEIYDLTSELDSRAFASSLARTQWENPLVPPVKKYLEITNFYSQSGSLHGTVAVNNGDDFEMYLFGEKARNLGKDRNFIGGNFVNILGSIPSNGFTLHVGKSSVPFVCNDLSFGFFVEPDATLNVIKEANLNFKYNNNESIKSFQAALNAGGRYEIHGRVIHDMMFVCSGNSYFKACFVELTVGNKQGFGLYLHENIFKIQDTSKKQIIQNPLPETLPMTVLLSDDISNFREISGGKGFSLGQLTKLATREKSFIVPKGVVVTTAAYLEFITPDILQAVKHLEDVAYGNVEGNIQEECSIVSDVIEKTEVSETICSSLFENLKILIGENLNTCKFAVRSSSTGEDGDEMSTAGLMDTFLGVHGFKKILLCVKRCWASQFSIRSVEYQRRFGQPLSRPMAVVVQEMVSCEVSGVLFTCDPLTGDPSLLTVTANYGLGETVVSGSVEPDTIILKKHEDDELSISSVLVGEKLRKIVMQESYGTATEDVPSIEKSRCSLSTELAKRLGKIALKIEQFHGSSRDIEWGYANGNFYILQSRPVTNATAETEFELKHELDAPLRCETDYYSVGNTGEILPGAVSPLGMELMLKGVKGGFRHQQSIGGLKEGLMSSYYYFSYLLPFYNHLMMDVMDIVGSSGVGSPLTKGLMIGIFGRVLEDADLRAAAREKRPLIRKNKKWNIKLTISTLKNMFFNHWGIGKLKQKLDKYEMRFLKPMSAKETFSAILSSCSDFKDIIGQHFVCTKISCFWNVFLFQFLSNANKGFDNDVYIDFARLLSTISNIESASIPYIMQEVAHQIKIDMNCEKFKSLPVEEALEWLLTSASQAGHKFRIFIERHGHRCSRELDILSKTWAMNPNSLVKLLQNLVEAVNHNEKKEEIDYEKLFSELTCPLGYISRCMLKFILPSCRKSVRARESTKSLFSKSVDCWRQGFQHLAKLMVSEGRLPDPQLIYFLHLDEIDELLETRSPNIVSRSIKRQKMFLILEEYRFPEMMSGFPKPINETNDFRTINEFPADFTIQGFPVSNGVTKGYATVALTVEEASKLKRGDVLITYSTDACWSPYFTLVSGVVTELGGLTSHGAVVAREYGLPCVVGVKEATRMFKTGDYVLLDGKRGILQRLPQPL